MLRDGWILLLLLISLSATAADSALISDQGSPGHFALRSSDPSLQLHLSELENRLPPGMTRVLNRSLQVEWAGGKQGQRFASEQKTHQWEKPLDWLGDRTRYSLLLLHPSFRDGESPALQFVILQALAEAYDAMGPSKIIEQQKKECRWLLKYSPTYEIRRQCDGVLSRTYRVSDSPEFMALEAYYADARGFVSAQRLSFGPDRTPREVAKSRFMDARELENPQTAFAVLSAHFVQNSALLQKRPAVRMFLSGLFGFPPPPESQPLYFSLALEENSWIKIEPSRVYQIRLLYTHPGTDSLTARWGHLAFEVVGCAPFREKVSADCLQDTDHHFSLSWHATKFGYEEDPAGMLVDVGRGLAGRYVAQLYAHRSTERHETYEVKRGQRLERFPLKMNPYQRQKLLSFLFENQLIYRGFWNHVASNCVTHLSSALEFVFNHPSQKDVLWQAEALTTPMEYVEVLQGLQLLGE